MCVEIFLLYYFIPRLLKCAEYVLLQISEKNLVYICIPHIILKVFEQHFFSFSLFENQSGCKTEMIFESKFGFYNY